MGKFCTKCSRTATGHCVDALRIYNHLKSFSSPVRMDRKIETEKYKYLDKTLLEAPYVLIMWTSTYNSVEGENHISGWLIWLFRRDHMSRYLEFSSYDQL